MVNKAQINKFIDNKMNEMMNQLIYNNRNVLVDRQPYKYLVNT